MTHKLWACLSIATLVVIVIGIIIAYQTSNPAGVILQIIGWAIYLCLTLYRVIEDRKRDQ